MRDFLQIGVLFFLFAFLVTRYPTTVPKASPVARPVSSFASFVTLSPSAHAARLEAARTSWQVRSKARGRPMIGRLDSSIPLLTDALPPPEADAFAPLPVTRAALPAPDADTYALMPPTLGAEMADFAIGTRQAGSGLQSAVAVQPPFDRKAMLATDDYRSIKEIMK